MRLPGAVSRLAAPFFGSQAEPSSRQRGMFRAIGGVCLAFGEIHLSYIFSCCCVVASSCLAYAWCHFDLRACLGEANHPSLLIDDGGELHLANGITHVAKFS